MKGKLKVFFILLLCLLFFAPFPQITASADMGPKPSVRIAFEGLGEETCYGTLLSKNSSTGPSSAWDGDAESGRHKGNDEYYDLDYEIWSAFVGYADTDGYYFLQEAWRVSETKNIGWTYYPPSSFKILLYFPERNVFAVSGIYERYAFDSYYTVDMTDIRLDEADSGQRLAAERSYDYTNEILSLLARILATVVIEIAIAWSFGLREKKQLWCLTGVNGATQIVLNVLLNAINYASGQFAFIAAYFLLEIIVFAVEAAVYALFMNRISVKQRRKRVYVGYAFVANAVSFIAGFGIALLIPGIF